MSQIRPIPLSLILLFTLVIYVSADVMPRHPIETYCTSNASATAANLTSIKTLLFVLTAAANNSGFHNVSVGSLYGLFLCRGDVSQSACNDCVASASAALPRVCPRSMETAIWYEECMIRYSNESFIGHADNGFNTTVTTATTGTNPNRSLEYQRQANSVVAVTTSAAATEAAFGDGGKFATKDGEFGNVFTVHVTAECTPDVGDADCYSCLTDCIGKLPTCCNKASAKVLFLSCNLGYEVRRLHNAFAPAPAPVFTISGTMKRRKSKQQILQIVAVSSSVLLLLMLLSFLWFCLYKKRNGIQVYEDNVSDIVEVESLHMEFNIIRTATQNFASDRKLGQGGFGQVYKGILENGQEIAVKRLSLNSGQGIAEFKTEVHLVAKLQHRNLVKLLGFCISGKERILVYEFLHNSSLDKFLFDATKRMSLNWETRFKIISGIARGLLYLHEDSRLKIVHRDLKSSNILLDEAMNPKIADFGLAKLFKVDQTQDATSTIVGTYGYMAPEYVFTGRYSVKSDVYSFGIMVLELVSGQRNYINRPRDDEALLQQAWRLWSENTTLSLVDETLGNDYASEEVTKCVQIGLLCIQENDTKRPNMTTVVAALSGQAIALPLPMPPSFCRETESSSVVSTSNSACKLEEGASVSKTSDISELEPR